MASEQRRTGCGCLLPLFVLVFVVPVAFGLVTGLIDELFEPDLDVWAVVAGLAVVGALIAVFALFRRRQREDAEDQAGRGSPTATGPSPPPTPSRPAPRPDSGSPPTGLPRGLRTEPEDEGTRRLKDRLAEAVSDLSQRVEDMPEGSGRRPIRTKSSEEMIAEAKERIRHWDRSHSGDE